MRRLSRAGFKQDFVRSAILPDWWTQGCQNDQALLPDLEFRVARFFGIPISVVRDTSHALTAPNYPGAQLRRVRILERERLALSIHSALQIGAAVVRNLRDDSPALSPLPVDANEWRAQIVHAGKSIGLSDVLTALWERGIPVVPLGILPAPSFQGLACIVEGRPVVMLGHKRDEPGRVAFIVVHEAGQIAANDCTPGGPVIDEEDVPDDTENERNADQYATRVLVGSDTVPTVNPQTWRDLANAAVEIEKASGIDASAVVYSWARKTNNYPMATLAIKALYLHRGARQLLRNHFDRHVNIDSASESDRSLLRCVYGDPESDAPTH